MKRTSLIIATLLLALATGCSEQTIDRTPSVHLVITGVVMEQETGTLIEGIQVSFGEFHTVDNIESKCPSVLTDEKGTYRLEYTGTPFFYAFITIEDIDGPAHGGEYSNTGDYFTIDYTGTRMEPVGSLWDFGTIELMRKPIMTVLKSSLP